MITSKLKDLIDLIIDYRGKTPKKLGGDWSESGYRVFSAKNIKTGEIVSSESIRYVNNDLYRSWMKDEIQKGDILITSEAPFGQIYFWDSDEKIVLGQRLFAIRPKKSVNGKYLYYYMTGRDFQCELKARATGTTVTGLRQPELLQCQVSMPSKEQQDYVAHLLGTLDKKIQINVAINDNLQKQAEAIYSRLFIDARNCNQVPLKDIANITMGQSPAGHSCSEKNEGTVFYQGRAEFGFRFPTRRLFTTEPKRMAKVGDILLSVRAPVGDTNVAYEDCCIGRGLSAIESKTGEPSFLLYTLRYLHHQFEVFNAEGTVFGSINKEQLNNFQINLPPKDKIKEFESIVRPMDDLIRMNFKENNLLNELKEKLLLNFFSNK